MGTLIRITGLVLITGLLTVNSFASNKDTVRENQASKFSGNAQYEKLQNALQNL